MKENTTKIIEEHENNKCQCVLSDVIKGELY